MEPQEHRALSGRTRQHLDPEIADCLGGGRRAVSPVLPEVVEAVSETEFGSEGRMTDGAHRPVAVSAQRGRERGLAEKPRRVPAAAPARIYPREQGGRSPAGLGPGSEGLEEHGPRRPEQIEVRTDVAWIAVDSEVVGAQRGDSDQDEARPLGSGGRARVRARGRRQGRQQGRQQGRRPDGNHAAALPGARCVPAEESPPGVHEGSSSVVISMRRAPFRSSRRRTRMASGRR